MSSVVISGDTSGSITLSAPAVAGTNTITLPATTGTVVLTGTTPTLNGITFPATQVPSADANTLDDYEEGTYNATLTPTTSGTITLSDKLLGYTKIGRQVTITGYLSTSSVSSPTGYLNLSLPFTAGSSNSQQTAGAFIGNALTSGNCLNFWCYVPNNNTTAAIFFGGSTSVSLTSANSWGGTTEARVCITYSV